MDKSSYAQITASQTSPIKLMPLSTPFAHHVKTLVHLPNEHFKNIFIKTRTLFFAALLVTFFFKIFQQRPGSPWSDMTNLNVP